MKHFPIVLFLLVAQMLTAQITISGEVLDASTLEPLIGANVVNSSDAAQGTITDFDGGFELSLETTEVMLIVSYLGYEDQMVLFDPTENPKLEILLSQSQTLLETTTITGSRYEKKLAESPVSINVIKPALIESSNSTIMSEVLNKVPGVQMIDGQANIRGGSGYSYGAGSRVMLLIDDIPAFQADAGRPLWDDIPVENISQIEVLKGASSALYGSAAMNGIVNIRTGYATSEPVTKAFVGYTAFLAPKDKSKMWWDEPGEKSPMKLIAGISHKQKFGKLDMVVAGFGEKATGLYQSTFKDKYRLSTNLKYRFSDRLTFGLNAMYNFKNSSSFLLWDNAREGAYQGWETTKTAGKTRRYYVDPQLTYYDKRKNKHKLLARYFAVANGSTTNQATFSNNTYLEYQFTGSKKSWDLEYTAGLASYFVNSNSELYGSVDFRNTNLAAFGQVDKKIGDKLTLTAGLRYEANSQNLPDTFQGDTLAGLDVSEGRLVSRFGLNYNLGKATFLRTSWGQGYRYPTIAERFIFTDLGGFFVLPNPALNSETGWTYEIGARQGLAGEGWNAYVDLALFRSEYQNMIEFTFGAKDGMFGFQSQNVGNTIINGAEVNVAGEIKIGKMPIQLLTGYTFIDPKYTNFDSLKTTVSIGLDGQETNVLKYRSKHNFKIDAQFTLDAFSFGGAYNYSSQMVTIDQFLSNLREIEQYRKLNPNGFHRLDARVGYTVKQIKCTLFMHNVTNKEYSIRPGVLEASRNVSLRLDFTF